MQLACSETLPAFFVANVYVAEAVPFEPLTVCVTACAPVIPEGVTVTLAEGVPTPEAEASVTVAEIVLPSDTLDGAVNVNTAASGGTVIVMLPDVG